MKNKFIGFCVVLLTLTVGSCNKDYDFDKIDGTAVIGQKLSIPIDGRDTVLISKIITLKDGDIIGIDENTGEYFLGMNAGDKIVQKIEITKIPPIEVQFATMSYSVKGLQPGESTITQTFNFPDNYIKSGNDVDKIITAIDNIAGNADGSYFNLTVSIDKYGVLNELIINKDKFKIECPEWLVFADAAKTDKFVIENNCIKLRENEKITKGNALVLKPVIKSIDITKFDGTHSSFKPGTPGRLILDDAFRISGSASIDLRNVSGPGSSAINADAEFSFTPKSAKVKAKPELKINIDPIHIDQSKLPVILRNEKTVIDLGGDFTLNATVSNEFPGTLIMNAGLSTTYKSDGKDYTERMEPFADAFLFRTTADTTVSRSKGMRQTISGNSLFYKVPHTITVDNPEMGLTDEFFNVEFRNYELDFQASFKAPLCLGEKLDIDYTHKLDFVVDLGKGTKIHDATLNIRFHNRLPFDIGVKPVVVDTTGMVIEKIHVESDITLKAGSLTIPVDTDAQIFLTSDEGFSSFGGFKFELSMRKGTSTPLNKDMGISFDNISLHTENGIFIDIKK